MSASYQDKHRKILKPIAETLSKLNINPNLITLITFFLTSFGVFLIVSGKPLVASVWLIITAPFDAVDGFVARLSGRESKFGAFLDSTLDRITDGVLISSVCWTFREDEAILLMGLTSLVMSFLISYTRARVEGLGGKLTEGLMSRYPRFLGFIVILLVWHILGAEWMKVFMAIYALLLSFTVFQRILLAYKRLG